MELFRCGSNLVVIYVSPHVRTGESGKKAFDSGLRYGIPSPVHPSPLHVRRQHPFLWGEHGRWLVVACTSDADVSRQRPTHQRTVVSCNFGRLTHAFGPLATQHLWSTGWTSSPKARHARCDRKASFEPQTEDCLLKYFQLSSVHKRTKNNRSAVRCL